MLASICEKNFFWLLVILWTISAASAFAMHPNPGHLARRYGGPNPKLYPPTSYDNRQVKYGSYWPLYGPRYQQHYSPSIVSYGGRPLVPTPSASAPVPSPSVPTPTPQQQKQQVINIGPDSPPDTDSLFPAVENIPLVYTSGEVVRPQPPPPTAVFPQQQQQQQQYGPVYSNVYDANRHRPYGHGHISLLRPTHDSILQNFRLPSEISYATASSMQHQHYGNPAAASGNYGIRPAHPMHHPIRLHPSGPPFHVQQYQQQQQQQQHHIQQQNHIQQHNQIQQSSVAHHAIKLVPSGGVQPNPLSLAHLPPPAPGGLVVVGPFSQPPGLLAPSQISHSNPTGVSNCCGDQPWMPVVDYTQPAAVGQDGGDQYLQGTQYVPSTERPGVSLFLPVEDREPTVESSPQYIPVLLSSNSSGGIQVFPSDIIHDNPFATANQSVSTQQDSNSIGSDNVAVFLSMGGSTTRPTTNVTVNDAVTPPSPPAKAPTSRPSLSSIIINLSHPVPASSDNDNSSATTSSSTSPSQTRPTSSSGGTGTRPARPAKPTPASTLSDTLFPTISEPAEDFGVPAEAAADETAAEGSFVEVLSQLLEEIAGIIEDFPPTELPGLDSAASNAASDSLGAPSGNIPDFGGLGGSPPGLGAAGNAATAGSEAGAGTGPDAAAGGGLGGLDAGAGALGGGAGPAAGGADSLGSGSNPRPVIRVPNTLEQSNFAFDSPNAVSGPFSPFVLLPPVNPQIVPPFGQLPQSASDVMLDVFNKAIESNPLDVNLNAGGLVDPDPEPEHGPHGVEPIFFQGAAPESEPMAQASSHSHGVEQQLIPVHFEPNQGRQLAAGTVEHFPDHANIAAAEKHGNPELANAADAVRHLGVIGSQSAPSSESANFGFSTPTQNNDIAAAAVDLHTAESANSHSPSREMLTPPTVHRIPEGSRVNDLGLGVEVSSVAPLAPTATDRPADAFRQQESATIRDYHAKAQAVVGGVFAGNSNLLDEATEQSISVETTSVGYTELAAGVPDAEGIPSDIRDEVQSNINIDLMKTSKSS